MTSIDLAAFARLHHLRAPRIAWLLGAGASASSGVPTAAQMTWLFKAMLFATETAVPRTSLDLGDPSVRQRIQRHFSDDPGCPAEGADDEYSFYFEKAYPRSEDRRAFIEDTIARGRPGFGHLALAVLMAMKKVGVLWTTNFDRLVEDATATLVGTTQALTVATLDSASVARDALRDGRVPLYAKLHGDYQSDRLKNIGVELQTQDAILRECVRTAAGQYGLAVVGYSGRDKSVLESLAAGLGHSAPYPAGLFWFTRGDSAPPQGVSDFLARARDAGVEAHVIRLDTFDELMGLLLTPFVVPPDLSAKLEALKPRSSKAPFRHPPAGRGFPVLRFNVLAVEEFPRTARLIDCEAGSTKAVREVIQASGATLLAHRRRDGVIAFGADSEAERVFRPHQLRRLDLAPLNPHHGSPSDLALLNDALLRAISRDLPLRVERRLLVVDPRAAGTDVFKSLGQVAGALSGNIPGLTLEWCEALELRLESRRGGLWLVLTPTLWAPRPSDEPAQQQRKEFFRKRLSGRYNKQSDELLRAWAHIVADRKLLYAFGLGTTPGVDASFKLDPRTAFSRHGG